MSAARLAAEAAFAGPRDPATPANPAQVIVRRDRRADPAAERPAGTGAGNVTSDNANAAPADAGKGPRVFRVEGVRSPAPHDMPPADTAVTGVVQRSRRIATDRRPGPVMHQVHATPLPQRAAGDSATALDLLRSRLADVGQLLRAVAHAQSLQFVDERFDLEWQQLSRKADGIRQDLQALRR